MSTAVLRVPATSWAPGPQAERAAADRLRRSADALGLLIAEPVTLRWTPVDEDGTVSLTERWILVSALIARMPA